MQYVPICDVVAQRIQTVEDIVEANKDEIFDWGTNKIIEQQQCDTEILIYYNDCDKEHKAAWDAYIKYANVADENHTQRIDAQITTLERILKAVQAAAEKQMIALRQETLQKIQNIKQTDTISHKLYMIHEELSQKMEEKLQEENEKMYKIAIIIRNKLKKYL